MVAMAVMEVKVRMAAVVVMAVEEVTAVTVVMAVKAATALTHGKVEPEAAEAMVVMVIAKEV